jgi:hypothetical protein
MDDKRPDQGVQDEGQDLYPERTVAGAPSTPHDQADDAGLAPAGPPPTGDERVDSALAGLNSLPGRPPEEHVAVLEEVHGRLRDILGELGETPETPEGREPR